jgi:PPPDE putative peptidase domain/PUL domain
MDVELYVYDLSGGLARQYSVAITGVYIDAIYHTAVVLGGVEYFFGQGVHRKVPGSTHHGRPMEVIPMGRTDLPLELIEEYIQSLESIYTPESYDLFVHNCNNFSQDLCMFLVGKSIPENISSLPETFLRTPIGQMMRGQIDQSMRRMTQAPDAVSGQSVRPAPRPNTSQANTNGVSQIQTNRIASSRPTFINSVPKEKGATSNARHPHSRLKLPLLDKRITQPTLAKTCPPLDKLLTRLGPQANGPPRELADYVKLRETQGSASAPIPNLHALSDWITSDFSLCPDQFAAVDLLRISAVDPRVSSFLTTERKILNTVFAGFTERSREIPYNLHFTSLQLALNIFSSPVAQKTIIDDASDLRSLLGNLAAASLLTNNPKIRLQAALLVQNLAAVDHNQRLNKETDVLNINAIADGAIESALVQAILDESESKETLTRLLFALGLLIYRAPEETVSSLRELCEAMEVSDDLEGKKIIAGEPIMREVQDLLKRTK